MLLSISHSGSQSAGLKPKEYVHKGDECPELIFSRTTIFTLDSLGSKHPSAVKTLSSYLKEEAKDKHGVEVTNNPIGQRASVSTQSSDIYSALVKRCP
jgi:hypothetical protein